MDLKKLSDSDIDKQIMDLNNKLNLTNNIEITKQLDMYLDLLYQEQDERMYIEDFDSTEGIVLDVEEKVEEQNKSDSKDKKKQNTKPKSFLEKIPKIEPRWNLNHPKNQQSDTNEE